MARRPRPAPPPEPIETFSGTDGDDFQVAILGTIAQFSGGGGNDYLKGWIRADVLNGGAGNDYIEDGDGGSAFAGGAADTLIGGGGNDRLYSNFGADLIDGGAGIDFAQITIGYAGTSITSTGASGSGATLTLSTGVRIVDVETLSLLLGTAGDRVTTGNSADSVNGNSGDDVIATLGGNDWLAGDSGNDRLDAGAGDDYLIGGSGTDTLIGGAGADRFYLDQLGGGLDRILDFSIADGDRLDGFFAEAIDDESFRLITDPVGEGLIRVSNVAEGTLVEVLVSGAFVSSALLVGVQADDLTPNFLI